MCQTLFDRALSRFNYNPKNDKITYSQLKNTDIDGDSHSYIFVYNELGEVVGAITRLGNEIVVYV